MADGNSRASVERPCRSPPTLCGDGASGGRGRGCQQSLFDPDQRSVFQTRSARVRGHLGEVPSRREKEMRKLCRLVVRAGARVGGLAPRHCYNGSRPPRPPFSSVAASELLPTAAGGRDRCGRHGRTWSAAASGAAAGPASRGRRRACRACPSGRRRASLAARPR